MLTGKNVLELESVETVFFFSCFWRQPNAAHDIYVTTEILQSSQNSPIQGEDVRPASGLLTRFCVMRFVEEIFLSHLHIFTF